MEQPLSPLNQGLNPVRAAGQWGQLVGLPAATPAIDSRVAQPLCCASMAGLAALRQCPPLPV